LGLVFEKGRIIPGYFYLSIPRGLVESWEKTRGDPRPDF